MGSKTRSEIKESVKPKVEYYADKSRQENVLLTGRHVCVTMSQPVWGGNRGVHLEWPRL